MDEQAGRWRDAWGRERRVWIAASTHTPEEDAVLEIHARLLERHPDAMLLWAPRHPERFAQVAGSAAALGMRVATRRADTLPSRDTQVFVIDTLGELLSFFAAADVAFVGGSLCDVGGHNVLEPAAVGIPSVVGPRTFNFADVTRRLRDAGALRQVRDAVLVGNEVLALLDDAEARARMGQAGRRQVSELSGALGRTLALLEPLLESRRA
jgi:3-deoxy-D-manno-octulosonic-acid transferase